MRLIDADALIMMLCVNMDTGSQFNRATHCVDETPTVDAEPVTRCAECVLYVARELKYDGTPDKRYKPSWCELWRAEMKGNDYCSRGEKK